MRKKRASYSDADWRVLLGFAGTVMWACFWIAPRIAGSPFRLPVMAIGSLVVLKFIISAFQAWRQNRARQRLLAEGQSLQSIMSMSWQQFELLVGQAYRQQGFRVVETGQGGADGGVDLVLIRGKEKILVQCKHWKTNKVGASVVREMLGLIHHEGATGAFIVTAGGFTREAWKFVGGKPIQLIYGRRLIDLVASGQKAI